MGHHHAIGPKNHSGGTEADVSLLCRNRVTLKKCRVKPKVETNAGWVPLCCMFQEPLCGVKRAGSLRKQKRWIFSHLFWFPGIWGSASSSHSTRQRFPPIRTRRPTRVLPQTVYRQDIGTILFERFIIWPSQLDYLGLDHVRYDEYTSISSNHEPMGL